MTRLAEVGLVALLAGAVFVVHDVEYLLSHPFWLDESWVAISTRAPLSDLPRITAVTPLGWTLLLHVVPPFGEQSLRLLPMAFSAATVAVAYLLGRELRVVSAPLTGALTAGAALLVPAMLVRNDLKHYTADAFVAVLLLLLVARVETRWSRRRLAALGGVAAGGMLVSHTAAFTGAAALLAVALAAASKRSVRRLRESVFVAATTAAVMALIYFVVDRRHVDPSLVDYWRGYYLPRDQGAAVVADFVRRRTDGLLPYLGVDIWTLWLLAGAALITLLSVGRRVATAATVPFVVMLVAGASAFGRYPFLDLRTSTFLLVVTAVFLAIGVAGVTRILARAHVLVGLAFVVLVTNGFLQATWPYTRAHTLPDEDVRSQVRYAARHARTGDVVLVNMSGVYGFAYYSHQVPVTFPATSRVATGFTVHLPLAAHVVLLRSRESPDVANGLAHAAALACRTSDARVWIVRTHLKASEAHAFDDWLRGRQVETLQVGPEPLLAHSPICP